MAREAGDAGHYAAGTPAPETASYEQLNVFGRPTGHQVAVAQGEPLPPLPRGFAWRLVQRANDGGV